MRSNFARNLRPALLAGLVLAIIQTIVETLTIAVLYREMVVAPYTFFSPEIYDGFTKIYLLASRALGLPSALDAFIGPGFVTKLALAKPLALMNLGVGLIAAALVSSVAAVCGWGAREPLRRGTRRFLVLLLATELAVHLVIYIPSVHIPDGGGTRALLRNFARDFFFGGTATAVALLAASGLASWLSLQRASCRSFALGAGFVAALTIGSSPRAASSSMQSAAGGALRPPLSIAKGYNVILVSIDSLRADHVGTYGYPRSTTPTIDAWARAGVRFRNTNSASSWTLPAHMSMMTGRSLLSHGVVGDDRTLPAGIATLAQALGEGGYHTGAIVSGPYLSSRYGFAHGFDEYDDTTITYTDFADNVRKVTAPLLQAAAEAWLKKNAGRRFFLFLHYWDVHYDYNPPPPYDALFDPEYNGSITGRNFYFNPAVNPDMPKADLDHVVALYDGEIRFVDDHLAKLERTIADLGLSRNTVVVVTADHGDEFFEHGNKGHHRTLYDEVVRVPLIVYVPGVTATRQVIDTEASIIDIFPTVLSLVGLESPAGVEGEDLSRIAFATEPERDRATLAELYRPDSLNMQASLRTPRTKVIQHFSRRLMEAYETPNDPEEKHPVANTSEVVTAASDLAQRLETSWRAYRDRVASGEVKTLKMDDDTKQRLRALGYVQ